MHKQKYEKSRREKLKHQDHLHQISKMASPIFELSCSSSIIIIPIFSNGANIADLAPITIFIFPLFYFFPFKTPKFF